MESGVCLVSTISTKFNLIWFSGIGRKNLSIIKHYTKHMLNTVGRFIHTKFYDSLFYFIHTSTKLFHIVIQFQIGKGQPIHCLYNIFRLLVNINFI
jgi:hypothetical protein